MLLAGELRKLDERHYAFIGQVKTFHNLSDLAELLPRLDPIIRRRFLPGKFILELRDKKRLELLETPDGLALRLRAQGKLCSTSTENRVGQDG